MELAEQFQTPIFDAVKNYVDSKVIAFHVPGHKQGKGLTELRDYLGEAVLKIDLNGMSDLDFATQPNGVIRRSQELAASAFGARSVFFLVNGTTSGVEAMIMSICHPGDEIIIPRNAHKSAFNGLILSGAMPVYVYPESYRDCGLVTGVTVENIESAIKSHPHAKAIFLINPSYYGVCPDLRSIVRLARELNMAVIVDEAHGTHFYFHEGLPLPAMKAGADASSISMHKTGGSLTQSAALLVGKGYITPEAAWEVLSLTFTTSASYLLLCSLDLARKQLAVKGRDLIAALMRLSNWARQEINQIDGLRAFGRELTMLPGVYDFDELKLTVSLLGLGITGYEAERILRQKYNLQIELADLYSIVPYLGVGDTEAEIETLLAALKELAKTNRAPRKNQCPELPLIAEAPKMVVTPREAFYCPKKVVRLENAADEIAGEPIMAYPPGIPIVSLGERISREMVDYIRFLKCKNCALQGASDPEVNYLRVLGTE